MAKDQQPMFEVDKREDDALNKSKIEVIKNLIFGENIQEYNSEFERLKKDILEKKRVLEALIDEVQTDLQATIDNVATDLNIRMTDLERNLETKLDDMQTDILSREELGQALKDLGKRISKK